VAQFKVLNPLSPGEVEIIFHAKTVNRFKTATRVGRINAHRILCLPYIPYKKYNPQGGYISQNIDPYYT
jgi:hypothetical protein